MSRFQEMDLDPAEIFDGVRALELLKKQKVPGHAVAVAQNLAAVSRAQRAILEAKGEIEERYVRRDRDEKPIPACVSEKGEAVTIDFEAYAGVFKEDRDYEAGDVVAADNYFFKARVNPPKKSRPTKDSEAWEIIGKLGRGFYVTDKDAFDEELKSINTESVPVMIRTIPAKDIESNEDVTAEMLWLPMLDLEDPPAPKKAGSLKGKTKKKEKTETAEA